MKRQLVFQVDLTKIGGEGDFPCPCCGGLISPDDTSGIRYEIVDVEEKNDSLEKLVVVCNGCNSLIHVVGFEALNKIL